jgi:hypothetical protein
VHEEAVATFREVRHGERHPQREVGPRGDVLDHSSDEELMLKEVDVDPSHRLLVARSSLAGTDRTRVETVGGRTLPDEGHRLAG